MSKVMDVRGAMSGLERSEFREFRVLLAFALVLFFCISALSRVLPGGQFLHDVIGRTQLVTQVPTKKSK